MDDSTAFLLITMYGNISIIIGIVVGVKTHSLILGLMAWLLAPLAAVVLFFALFGGGGGSHGSRVSMPNPQNPNNNPYDHRTRF